MKNKFLFKTFLKFTLIIFFLVIVLILYSINLIKKQYINSLDTILAHKTFILNEKVKIYFDNKNFSGLDKYIKDIGKSIKTRITIMDSNGEVIADSEKNPKEMENHKEKQEIKKALTGIPGRSIRYCNTLNQEMLYFAMPEMDLNNNIKYIIRTSLFITDVNKKINNLWFKIILILLIFLFLFLIVIYFYSKWLYKPVYYLKEATQKIAAGNFTHKINLHKKNEFKELADNFDMMVDDINKLFSKVKERQIELEIILNNIREGILILDSSGKIIFFNNEFSKIANCLCKNEKFYWEILLSSEIIKNIEKIRTEKKDFFKEVEIAGKILICNCYFISEINQIVLLFTDVTPFKQLEKIKKDIVANVSHELKTPITAIEGFTETALSEAKDKNIKKYLQIIKNNSERLKNILNDLLLLSQIEHKTQTFQLETTKINFKKLIDNIYSIFEKKLKEKSLKFIKNLQDELPDVYWDEYMIEQMFINLLDNAIKYTDKGEIKINIYKKNDNYIIIEFSDTGIGIEEKHLPRIFERFYVVDKSRSREFGGTGLGLSIVKHIVELHKGEIEVNSNINKGTKFIIILPIKPK